MLGNRDAMTAAELSVDVAATGAVAAAEPSAARADDHQPAGDEPGVSDRDRRAQRLALVLALLPFAVSAGALVVAVGGSYVSVSDHALTEMHVRDIGRHEVLVGLYSRADWSHPGPILFYVLAPFYWLTGGLAIGMNLGALAINGASVAGMGLIARRRGGTPLMLLTLLACTLLLRTLGAEFAHDPWNAFVTVLPFGLMIFLAWSMWCGEAWALPVGAAVATFLAQTHVGFVALAVPLLAWGAAGLGLGAWRRRRGEEGRAAVRRTVRAAVVAAIVLLVAWLPPLVEVVLHAPGNLPSIYRWFRAGDEGVHTLGEGWRVMSAQFGMPPEWLTTKRTFAPLTGQSPYVVDAPVPWLLLVAGLAAVVLWRRRETRDARSFLLTLAFSLALGVASVARTVGPAFDYRLRWSFVPAMLAIVAVGWAGWAVVAGRWRHAEARLLVPLTLGALAIASAVNVYTAATAGTPQEGDSAAIRSLTPQVVDGLPETDGKVMVTDVLHSGAWQARALVLELERRGIDVGVPADRAELFGQHRVVEDDEVGTVLVVAVDHLVDKTAAQPGLRPIAEWSSVPEDELRELLAERERVGADATAMRIGLDEAARVFARIDDRLGHTGSVSYHVVVFVDENVADAGRSARP
jgi:MYXO-CTERM domain-containing protein